MGNFDEEYYKTGNYLDYLQRVNRYKLLADDIVPFLKEPVLDFGCAVGFLVSALRKLDVNAFGYDVSEWAVNYGKGVFGLHDFLSNEKPNASFNTLLAIDVFEHMPLDVVHDTLTEFDAEVLIVRIPVAAEVGEDFFLDISRRDKTHITCLTKSEWEEVFSKAGYRLAVVFDRPLIWDSEGVLSRAYVKDR